MNWVALRTMAVSLRNCADRGRNKSLSEGDCTKDYTRILRMIIGILREGGVEFKEKE